MPYFSNKNLCNHFNNFFTHSNPSCTSVQFLQNRCQILEHILYYSEISPMNNVIKDFKFLADFYLHQLAKEVENYRFSSDERSQHLDFADFLHSAAREIEDMLLVQH